MFRHPEKQKAATKLFTIMNRFTAQAPREQIRHVPRTPLQHQRLSVIEAVILETLMFCLKKKKSALFYLLVQLKIKV